MLERVKTGMAEYAYEAGKRGVSIALETDTHPGINRILPELISEADSESCGICFDTGHAQIESDAVQTVKWIGARVICTHLHDNDGKKDQHLPPFKGIIAWEKFLRGLTAAGYGGTYTFDCGGELADIVEARRRFEEMLNTLAFTA
ncbi:MAG: sugar phosphate isomerase/epimerase [Candidatus Aminicenantes bacterium]|nr:sugar phosphate isomerase/epimerase [Candidatus Aminicenantes bacterium]